MADSSINNISRLSDEIILHILLFLPLKDAVRTSILSTRWRYLYASISSLNLVLHSSEKADQFDYVSFVDRVLFFRNRCSVDKFQLYWFVSQPLDPLRLKYWISAAMWHGIRELDLWIPANFLLPTSLFTHKTLVVLKLKNPDSDDSDMDSEADSSDIHSDSESDNLELHCEPAESGLKVPTEVHLPSLKVLCLSNVTFSNDGSLSRLLSNCPILEDLHYCFIGNVCKLGISNLTVKRLSIEYYRPLCRYGSLEIAVNCPNLVFLDYNIICLNSHTFVNFQSLTEANIKYNDDCYCGHDGRIDAAIDLMRGICNIQKLKISCTVLADLLKYSIPIPFFHNLTHLTISWPLGWDSVQVPDFLARCESLETLIFLDFHCTQCNPDAWDQLWESGVSCLSSLLKTIEIYNFDGIAYQMEAVKRFLRSARVLESLVIQFGFMAKDYKQQLEITKELLMLSRVSKECSVFIL